MMREETATSASQHRPAPHEAAADKANQRSWLLCRAGSVLCALPIEQVLEIMRLLPIEPMAGAPKYVRGLSIVRGAPVPVVDLGVVIGDRTIESTRLITVRVATRTIALAVEAVLGITAVASSAFGQLPPLLRDAASDTVTAIGALDSELIVFLRAARLVPDDVFARVHAEAAAP